MSSAGSPSLATDPNAVFRNSALYREFLLEREDILRHKWYLSEQEVALIDARKAIAMFRKVNVEILGLVENMSYFSPPGSKERHAIFGSGGGAKEAERQKVSLLAEIPLDPLARQGGDEGRPVVLAGGGSSSAPVFQK